MSGKQGQAMATPTAPVTIDVSGSSNVIINLTLSINGADLGNLFERLLLALEATTAKR